MNTAFIKTRAWLSFTEVLCVIFFISIICAFRAVTSISIALMILAGIIQQSKISLAAIVHSSLFPFFTGCVLFFFWQTFSLLYTGNFEAGLNDTRLKTGLLFTPCLIFFIICFKPGELKKLLSWYCVAVFLASIYLLIVASIHFSKEKDISVFFYHTLVSPFRYHAVYYSILVFIALSFLLDNPVASEKIFPNAALSVMIVFLSAFLLLLSSKLVISYYAIYIIVVLIGRAGKRQVPRLFIYTSGVMIAFGTLFIMLTKNPVGNRFRDFASGNINLIFQNKFSPSVYFNGLQFRLLQWKLVPEILSEKHRWWLGISTGDAQRVLNEKYIALNMYRGEPGKPDGGYLDYNTHNQLLQSLLQSGIPGALIYLFIYVSLLLAALKSKEKLFRFTVFLLLIYLFVESLFQEQYGLVIFIFWPLFFSQLYKQNSQPEIKI
ncbi:MAG: O-antigen ligase family protein [Chitinophagaceae bacterium]